LYLLFSSPPSPTHSSGRVAFAYSTTCLHMAS
jgi:hypothetical protein